MSRRNWYLATNSVVLGWIVLTLAAIGVHRFVDRPLWLLVHVPMLGHDRRGRPFDLEMTIDREELEQLTAHLAERGRLEWALDECQALRARGQVVRDPDDAWLRIKEARSS